jgi:hypothetical protein
MIQVNYGDVYAMIIKYKREEEVKQELYSIAQRAHSNVNNSSVDPEAIAADHIRFNELCSTHQLPDVNAERDFELQLAVAAQSAAMSSHSGGSSNSTAETDKIHREKSAKNTESDVRCRTMPERYQDIGIVLDVLRCLGTTVVLQGTGESLAHDR